MSFVRVDVVRSFTDFSFQYSETLLSINSV